MMTMQADELKTLRKGLGLSQQAFADALGLSRKAINSMEGGRAPIERRTELAALYLQITDAASDTAPIRQPSP